MGAIDIADSLSLFTSSLLGFVNDLLNSIFTLLADLFGSLRINLLR